MTIANRDWLKTEATELLKDSFAGVQKTESAVQRGAYIRMVDERHVKDLLIELDYKLKPSEVKALPQKRRGEYMAEVKQLREMLNNGAELKKRLEAIGITAQDWSEKERCFLLPTAEAVKLVTRMNWTFVSVPKDPFPLNGDAKATRTVNFVDKDGNEDARTVRVNCLSTWWEIVKPKQAGGGTGGHTAEDGKQGGATNVVDALTLVLKDGDAFALANYSNDDAFRAVQNAQNVIVAMYKRMVALRNEAHPAAKAA